MIFNMVEIIYASRVFRAAELEKEITLDWDNQLRDDGEDLVASLLQQIVDTHDCETSVRVDFLSASVNKNWQVVVVI